MDKRELLEHLTQIGSADAFGLDYPAAAMALLRLSRQSLVVRHQDADTGLYWYALSEHGQARLDYFQRLAR